nr:MAG TPA: hypothetical protein [Caudoviricetes sp.]
MMGLMIHEREELERLRVCVVEQAAAIERLDDEIRKNKETARDAMGLVEIAKKQQPRGPTLMGIARPLTLSICCVGQLRK